MFVPVTVGITVPARSARKTPARARAGLTLRERVLNCVTDPHDPTGWRCAHDYPRPADQAPGRALPGLPAGRDRVGAAHRLPVGPRTAVPVGYSGPPSRSESPDRRPDISSSGPPARFLGPPDWAPAAIGARRWSAIDDRNGAAVERGPHRVRDLRARSRAEPARARALVRAVLLHPAGRGRADHGRRLVPARPGRLRARPGRRAARLAQRGRRDRAVGRHARAAAAPALPRRHDAGGPGARGLRRSADLSGSADAGRSSHGRGGQHERSVAGRGHGPAWLVYSGIAVKTMVDTTSGAQPDRPCPWCSTTPMPARPARTITRSRRRT